MSTTAKRDWLTLLIDRIGCIWNGHNWTVTRVVRAANWHLAHLHPLAGCDADCVRCGAEWRDFERFACRPWLTDGKP